MTRVTGQSIQLAIRLPTDLVRWLDDRAAAGRTNRSATLKALLEEAMHSSGSCQRCAHLKDWQINSKARLVEEPQADPEPELLIDILDDQADYYPEDDVPEANPWLDSHGIPRNNSWVERPEQQVPKDHGDPFAEVP